MGPINIIDEVATSFIFQINGVFLNNMYWTMLKTCPGAVRVQRTVRVWVWKDKWGKKQSWKLKREMMYGRCEAVSGQVRFLSACHGGRIGWEGMTFVVDCQEKWCWWDMLMFCWLCWTGGWVGWGVITFVVDCHKNDVGETCWCFVDCLGMGGDDVRCWLPRNMMLVRHDDVLLIVLEWGMGWSGGDDVRCWLPQKMMLVRHNDVLLIVLEWGPGWVGWVGDDVRCWLPQKMLVMHDDVLLIVLEWGMGWLGGDHIRCWLPQKWCWWDIMMFCWLSWNGGWGGWVGWGMMTFVVDCQEKWCWWDMLMFCWLCWTGGWVGWGVMTFVVDCHKKWCWWDIMVFCWLSWNGGWGGWVGWEMMTFVVDCHETWCWWDMMMFCWLCWTGGWIGCGVMTFVVDCHIATKKNVGETWCFVDCLGMRAGMDGLGGGWRSLVRLCKL